jgi:hypothetical protein
MQLESEIKKLFNKTIDFDLQPETIVLLEDFIKLSKSNFNNKVEKTIKKIDKQEMTRLRDLALLQYDLIVDFFYCNSYTDGYYYFNHPITAKTIAYFNLKNIITKLKKPRSPFPFNQDNFIKCWLYYYKTLENTSPIDKLLFKVGKRHSDIITVFFNNSIEYMDKDIFNLNCN